MLNTKVKGTISELFIAARLMQCGYKVSIPLGDVCRYDLLIDDGTSIAKVQCKRGCLVRGCVVASTASVSNPHLGGKRKGYIGQVEFFAVHWADRVFLIPVKDAGSEIRLRISESRNKQCARVRWAKKYEI